MTFNFDMYNVKKYYLKWLRVLYCVKGLGFKSHVCYLCVYKLLLLLF